MQSTQAPTVRIYFEGRYRKLVRDLPQTIFFCPDCKGRGRNCQRCDGYGKLTKDSVQELIARVAMPRFKGRKHRFHGAGREDVDVRMLGGGRPFVFDIDRAKRFDVDLNELREEVNRRYEGRIELSELTLCGRQRVVEIKEMRCAKEYRARIRFDEQVAEAPLQRLLERGRIEIVQRTPERVSHRRADLERERWIECLAIEQDGEDRLLTFRTAHGTYVKEAISSDGGRTTPSISSLVGVPCACTELDVIEILDGEAVATAPREEPRP